MQSRIPVNEGEEYDVEIISEGAKGDGICKIDGYTIFVPGSKNSQKLKIRITRALEKFGFAEIVSSEEENNSESEDTEDF